MDTTLLTRDNDAIKEAVTRGQDDKNRQKPLPGPAALALLTLMAGPHVSLFTAYPLLQRLSASLVSRLAVLVCGIGFPLLYIVLLMWKTKWYWASIIVIATHIVCAGGYYFFIKRLCDKLPKDLLPDPATSRRKKHYIVTGMLAGPALMLILGTPFAIMFLLFSDRLLLTLMPLAFDNITSLVMLGHAMFILAVSGFIAGGWAGKLALKATPLRTLAATLGLVLISQIWFFLLIILIMLPAFLSSEAGSTMGGAISILFIGSIFIGSWWTVFQLMHVLTGGNFHRRLIRACSVPLVCLSSACVFGLVFGLPAQWYHSAGKYFEKRGHLSSALWCYEQGLGRNPSGPHASYLQFQIALDHHKIGNENQAVNGFRQVVALYNYNEKLVKQANQFLDNIERNSNSSKTREVLPGVDNPTTYKGAYCAPNSLALVMNFWQADVHAVDIGKEITGLATGTMKVDQNWYAQQHGFDYHFIPMAEINDIKIAIDAGFPVMVYVPQHVFVIVGYDEILETFVTYDVATSEVWVEYLQKDFSKTWKRTHSTMVLAYPQTRLSDVPAALQEKIVSRDDGYLHYHLHMLQGLGPYRGDLGHLESAVTEDSPFFLPLISLFNDYPAWRKRLLEKYDMKKTVNAITSYYRRDFDEATHLAGQYDSDDPDTDESFEQSLNFMLGTGHVQETQNLLETVQANGPLSYTSQEILAIAHLALGNSDRAIKQLEEQNDNQLHFYLGMSYLSQGRKESALTELVKTIDDCT